MMELSVIKIGGNIIDDEENLQSFLVSFAAVPGKKILVHGGGKLASDLAARLQIPQQKAEGRRITNKETLDIVTMVYAGLINKKITAKLQSLQCNVLGLSGADANIILAHKRSVTASGIDYGYVGDIDHVSSQTIHDLLRNFDAIVIAPITHDGEGQLLNTNADTIAKEVAIGMSNTNSVKLIYCFEKNGVLMDVEDDKSVIPAITPELYTALLKEKNKKGEPIIADGMIPKLTNALATVEAGVKAVVIGNAMELGRLLSGAGGTTIKKSSNDVV